MSWASDAPDRTSRGRLAWSTRDIMIAAVIAAALGVFMAGLNWVYTAAGGTAGSPVNVLYGGWLLPAVVAPAIIRKPGAALFAEMVAASLSVLLSSPWGTDALVSGFLQGIGAELVFAAFAYRRYGLPVLVLASVASTAGAFLHDVIVNYPGVAGDVLAVTFGEMLVSAVVLMPAVTLGIVRALRQAGVLRGFET